MEMYSSDFFSPELLREKFENDLEISGKTKGIYLLKNVTTLLLEVYQVPMDVILRYFLYCIHDLRISPTTVSSCTLLSDGNQVQPYMSLW